MKMFACDIDNTLMHSKHNYRKGDICIEKIDGKESGFISPKAYALFKTVFLKTLFVPVTTRSLEQYQRISLFHEYMPQYAITSNGGVLLHNNSIDCQWASYVAHINEINKSEMNSLYHLLSSDSRCFSVRMIDDVFLFAKSEESINVVNTIRKKIDINRFNVYSNKQKIYVIPIEIDKGKPIESLMSISKCDYLFSAGDSDIDLPMLNAADCAFSSSKELYDKVICSVKYRSPEKENDYANYFLDRVMVMIKKMDSKAN